jgi:hypothetical protein
MSTLKVWPADGRPMGKNARDPNARIAKAYATHERIEAELARVMNRWQKSRALLKRLGKQLDAAYAAEDEKWLAKLSSTPKDEFNDEV